MIGGQADDPSGGIATRVAIRVATHTPRGYEKSGSLDLLGCRLLPARTLVGLTVFKPATT